MVSSIMIRDEKLLTYSSTCGGAADGHATARYHIVGSVQTGDGQRNSTAERDVAARAMECEEQVVATICSCSYLPRLVSIC
jgi:hypothetical protein